MLHTLPTQHFLTTSLHWVRRSESLIAVFQHQFGLNELQNKIAGIDGMRTQVNKAKHNPSTLMAILYLRSSFEGNTPLYRNFD